MLASESYSNIIVLEIYNRLERMILRNCCDSFRELASCNRGSQFPSRQRKFSSGRVSLFISRRASVFQKSLPSARASSGSHARVCVMSPVRENRCPFKRETRSFPLPVSLAFPQFEGEKDPTVNASSSFSGNRLFSECFVVLRPISRALSVLNCGQYS